MGLGQRKVATQESKPAAETQQPPPLLGATAIRPPQRSGCEALKYLIYDKNTGAIFTRTPKSWLLIILFYVVFYAFLAGFWYGILTVFMQFVPLDRPRYTTVDSLIGNSPGLGLRPRQPDASIASSLLFLRANASNETPSHDFETGSNIDWAKRYQEFLETYNTTDNLRECNETESGELGQPACHFHLNVLEECQEFPYGYEVSGNATQVEPCVLLKINRIYDWIPEAFEEFDLGISDMEDSMLAIPDKIKDLVRADKYNVYINCEGAYPSDVEALANNVVYFPSNQGIPFRYFPYHHVNAAYQSPLVAVKFKNLPRGQLVHVECKAWYKGVVHDRKERQGLISFEILIQ